MKNSTKAGIGVGLFAGFMYAMGAISGSCKDRLKSEQKYYEGYREGWRDGYYKGKKVERLISESDGPIIVKKSEEEA